MPTFRTGVHGSPYTQCDIGMESYFGEELTTTLNITMRIPHHAYDSGEFLFREFEDLLNRLGIT